MIQGLSFSSRNTYQDKTVKLLLRRRQKQSIALFPTEKTFLLEHITSNLRVWKNNTTFTRFPSWHCNREMSNYKLGNLPDFVADDFWTD